MARPLFLTQSPVSPHYLLNFLSPLLSLLFFSSKQDLFVLFYIFCLVYPRRGKKKTKFFGKKRTSGTTLEAWFSPFISSRSNLSPLILPPFVFF
jgi:hypothetical protein